MRYYLIIFALLCVSGFLQADQPGILKGSNNIGPTGISSDIMLEKGINTSGPYNAGDTITYIIIAINMGPNTATNIVVTDSPTNLTITSVSSTNCTALPCTIPSLNNGAAESITLTATINAGGAFDNSATATADQPDPNPSNNTDNTGNGGTASGAASGTAQSVPGLNWLALILLASFMTAALYRRKLI